MVKRDTGETNVQETNLRARHNGSIETDQVMCSNIDCNKSSCCSFEFESEVGENECKQNVKGSLKSKLQWWISNTIDCNVIDIIKHGYKIPFLYLPPGAELKNNRSAIDNMNFVYEAVEELKLTGRVILCKTKPKVVNPLTVSINSRGKKRLVLDLRHVNKFIWHDKRKYEGIKSFLKYVTPGGYMISFDLRSGYHHVDIFEKHQDYLGFAVDYANGKRYFKFTVLPFGMVSSGSVFTDVVKAVVSYLRRRECRIVVYLDDGICVGRSKLETETWARTIINTLIDAGFVINWEKSQFRPVQRLKWLGFIFDLNLGVIDIDDRKLKNVLLEVTALKTFVFPTTKQMAAVVGKITALQPALGDVVYIMTKFIQHEIAGRASWNQRGFLSQNSLECLVFWEKYLALLPRMRLFEKLRYTRIVYSDASGTGAGGYIANVNGSESFVRWDENEKGKSSTWREFKTVVLLCNALKTDLSGQVIKWYSDNTNVAKVAKRGSMIKELQCMALEFNKFVIENNMQVEFEWLPRSQNQKADMISRSFDFDDWSVSQHIFDLCQARWGECTVDAFADHLNAKMPKFYSKCWCPGTSGVDAFAFSWVGEHLWLVPPVYIIHRVIAKLKKDKASGILVLPKWPSASFWPFVCHNGEYINEVVDFLEFSHPTGFFKAGSCKKSVFAKAKFNSSVMVMFLQG